MLIDMDHRLVKILSLIQTAAIDVMNPRKTSVEGEPCHQQSAGCDDRPWQQG